jgi:hypothetical protein
MDRYMQSAQLWIGRADRWQAQVIAQWNLTHTLPPPDQAGLPVPPGTAAVPAQKPPKPRRWWQM